VRRGITLKKPRLPHRAGNAESRAAKVQNRRVDLSNRHLIAPPHLAEGGRGAGGIPRIKIPSSRIIFISPLSRGRGGELKIHPVRRSLGGWSSSLSEATAKVSDIPTAIRGSLGCSVGFVGRVSPLCTSIPLSPHDHFIKAYQSDAERREARRGYFASCGFRESVSPSIDY